MYCLGCKDWTDNFKSKEVKNTNKVLIEKSNCIVCWSKKNNLATNIFVLSNYKTWIFIVKTVKKHTECTHPKMLVLISNKKAKVKSKCAECLTDRTFFDKIKDEYDLEHDFSMIVWFCLYWGIL